MDGARQRFLASLEKLPMVIEAKRQADSDRREQRRKLLARIETAREKAKQTDAELAAKAAPLDRRLAELRAEITTLEQQLEPLARSRLEAMSSHDNEIATLRAALRSDAEECESFQRSIEITRSEVAGNGSGLRPGILDSVAPSAARISSALAITLEAYNECRRVAIEEADIPQSLNLIRKQLLEAGIRLIE